ncbi:MAG: endo alpha-1,4 polygalactosaminidase [Janthinobacterium lividum]
MICGTCHGLTLPACGRSVPGQATTLSFIHKAVGVTHIQKTILAAGVAVSIAAAGYPVAGQGAPLLPMPAPVLDHIPEAQAMDHQIVAGDDLSNIYFVFSGKRLLEKAQSGGSQVGRKGGALIGYYYPNQRDMDRTHTLEWFNAHHPDWVTYACDRKTPSYGYTYGWGAYIPIDTTNPEVRSYLLATYFVPAARQGFRAIALDNVAAFNSDHRCGVFRNGSWVQLYSGDANDARYAADKMDYLRWVTSEMHSRGVSVAMNAKVDPKAPELTQRLVDLADIWIDEGAFLNGCKGVVTDALWDLRRRLVQSIGPDRAYDSINKSCAPSFAQAPAHDADYAVASFLIVRTARSYLSLFGMAESGRRVQTPYVHQDIGAPAGPAKTDGGVWWRPYATGLAVVNPSSTAAGTLTLPSGRWVLDGRQVSSVLPVPPATGFILHAG